MVEIITDGIEARLGYIEESIRDLLVKCNALVCKIKEVKENYECNEGRSDPEEALRSIFDLVK